MTREEDESRESADGGAIRKAPVELKARLDSPCEIERRRRASGARFPATLHQRDVYFRRVLGRLKLRIQRPGRDQLVWYDRPDVADTKESRIVLIALPTHHGLEPVLGAALGVRVVVSKVRRVFEWRGTRVHLDEVEGLGAFLEFERTVDRDTPSEFAHSELRAMLGELRISSDSLQTGSYSDLLLAVGPPQSGRADQAFGEHPTSGDAFGPFESAPGPADLTLTHGGSSTPLSLVRIPAGPPAP